MRNSCRWLACLILVGSTAGTSPAGAPVLTYERDVRPLLKTYCFQCHGEAGVVKGRLDLRLRHLAIKGGRTGPALEPGKPDDSRLLQRVENGEMPPPGAKLRPKPAEIERLRQWIAAGAPTARPEPKSLSDAPYFTEEDRNWWAFQPIRRPAVPTVKHADLVRTPIDAFLLAKLEDKGLSFAPEADRATLIRRLTFDLLGLPPSPEEVDRFVADTGADAYEQLVERLLKAPQYGERWGRHWLDVAGYADSEGYHEADPLRPSAYRYRDYVVRAFNADMPIDRFIQEQLAGDEMVSPPYRDLKPDALDKLTATGFLRMVPDGTGTENTEVLRNQVIADTLQVVSTSLLGMTVQCARCHDHRFDPISHVDYHRLRALFEPALDAKAWRTPLQRRILLPPTAEERRKAGEIDAEAAAVKKEQDALIKKWIDRVRERELQKVAEAEREAVVTALETPAKKRSPEQKQLLERYPKLKLGINRFNLELFLGSFTEGKAAQKEIVALTAKNAALLARKPAEQDIRALTEVPGRVPVTHLFFRGDPEQPKQAVAPGDLLVLSGVLPVDIAARAPQRQTTGRRLAFAQHLTNGQHPLFGRVFMNRVWALHFGRGIVGTLADFGRLGEQPSHPELLDYLASELPAHGWSLKALHRLLVCSTAYRQSAQRSPKLDTIDPDNRLWGRASLRRLEAEAVRDAMLTVSGQLDATRFGPPVPLLADPDGGVSPKVVKDSTADCRRSIYLTVRRTQPVSVLESFDAPLVSPNCEVRTATTVATQSLLLLNSAFAVRTAAHLAERVRTAAGDDLDKQVRTAWRLAFGVAMEEREVTFAVQYLTKQAELLRARPRAKDDPEGKRAALASFCQALLGSNRFLYVE